MELSAEEYGQIVRRLGQIPPSASGHENRRAPRISQRARLTIIPVDNGEARTAVVVQLHNISSRGMGFLYRTAMADGAQFIARLTRAGNNPINILCTVAHCRPLSKDVFSIGAEFTCVANSTSPKEAANAAAQADRIRQSILGG